MKFSTFYCFFMFIFNIVQHYFKTAKMCEHELDLQKNWDKGEVHQAFPQVCVYEA